MLASRSLSSRICIALACALGVGHPAHALVTLWDASSGLLPDQVDPAWSLTDNAPATDPVLSAGVLTLSTAAQSQNMFYNMTGTDLDFSAASGYWLEGTMKFVSGTQDPAWVRSPATMAMRFDNGNLAILEIRRDTIIIRNGDNSAGATNATVDTDGAFHTYRMEIAGKSAGSIINVYQDGALVLSDNGLYSSGGGSAVFFGESSVLATGTSQWTYFSHNAAAVAAPEPGSLTTLVAGCIALAARRRRKRR